MAQFYRSNSITMNENRDSLLLPPANALETVFKRKKHVDFQKPISNENSKKNHMTTEEAEIDENFKTMLANQNEEIAKLKVLVNNLEAENHKLKNDKVSRKNSSFIIPPLAANESKNPDSVKSQLVLKTAELNVYKEKVLELQCKLIETKDHQLSSLDDQTDAGKCLRLEGQLNERTRKLRALENAYRTQDKIIQKFEEIFRKKMLHYSTEKSNCDVKTVESLLSENDHLKLQLKKYQDVSSSANQSFDASIQQRIDFLETRTQILEKQMTENARLWAKEKTEMQLAMQQLK